MDNKSLTFLETIDNILRLIDESLFKDAEIEVEPLLKRAPFDNYLNHLAAYIYYELGKYDEADDALRITLHGTPQNEHARYLLFKIRERQGRIEDAEQIITNLLRDFPSCEDALADLALLQFHSYKFERANETAIQTLGMHPACHTARFVVLSTEVIMSRETDSIRRLTSFIKSNPEWHAKTLAMALQLKEIPEKTGLAIRLWEVLMNLSPEDYQLKKEYQDLLAKSKAYRLENLFSNKIFLYLVSIFGVVAVLSNLTGLITAPRWFYDMIAAALAFSATGVIIYTAPQKTSGS